MALVETQADPKEFKIPVALLAVGLAIYLAHAFFAGGTRGLAGELLFMSIAIVIQVILGIIACFLAARLAGCNYGTLGAACWKLAAVFIFPGAVATLIPWSLPSWIASLLLYWGLLEYLFELEAMETIITVIAIWLARVAAIVLALLTVAGLNAR